MTKPKIIANNVLIKMSLTAGEACEVWECSGAVGKCEKLLTSAHCYRSMMDGVMPLVTVRFVVEMAI